MPANSNAPLGDVLNSCDEPIWAGRCAVLKIKRVSRFSVAVDDLSEGRELYERVFGATYRYGGKSPKDDYETAIMALGADDEFELLAPTSDNSPIARFLSKHGPGLYHITLEVENLDEAIKEAKALGLWVVLGQEHGPREQYLKWREAYVHPNDVMGVFYSLVEITPHPKKTE